jgi:hypothetical protein
MLPKPLLNVFYKYVFHFWDYQKYVFENMMVNEFSDRVYSCGMTDGGCQCKSLPVLSCYLFSESLNSSYFSSPLFPSLD